MEETKSKNQRRRLNYWLQWQKSEQDCSIFAIDILPNRANKALLNVVLPPLPNLKCCTLQTKDAYKLSFPSGKFALLQLVLAEFFHALTRIVQSTNQLLPSPSCAHARRLCRGLAARTLCHKSGLRIRHRGALHVTGVSAAKPHQWARQRSYQAALWNSKPRKIPTTRACLWIIISLF